jgi:hypothetical protein
VDCAVRTTVYALLKVRARLFPRLNVKTVSSYDHGVVARCSRFEVGRRILAEMRLPRRHLLLIRPPPFSLPFSRNVQFSSSFTFPDISTMNHVFILRVPCVAKCVAKTRPIEPESTPRAHGRIVANSHLGLAVGSLHCTHAE